MTDQSVTVTGDGNRVQAHNRGARPPAPAGGLAVGRIVHYVSHGTPILPDGTQAYHSECRPAMVVEVGAWITVDIVAAESYSRSEGRPIRTAEQWFYSDAATLHVQNPTGQFDNVCKYDGGSPDADPAGGAYLCDGRWHAGGTWHWPARV